ncbi:hypothetical protein HPB50_016004 [Hyalomma asiaticum]|uniref:Uncharacterized protein n=1 Tax=Hyalomma asiaticum TaxID=266040 RepID=A0ACB7T7X6_HYAAI|nr:hypothetical protein HPB50_016004 [Hyalomma asiaticum]
MTLRLHPDQGIDILVKQMNDIGGPLAVKELDLTNCVLLHPDRVFSFIEELTCLQLLRCLSCALTPRDLLTLLLQRLPHLVGVEFSLVVESVNETYLSHMLEIGKQDGNATIVPVVRRIYVEVGYDQNFQILWMFLRLCPKLDDLHVHFVQGNFWKALLECPCRPLCDLVVGCNERRVLPSQLVAVILDFKEELAVECIRIAGHRHDWTHVRELCLVLFPAEACSIASYPTAGGRHRDSLLHFFSKALVNLVELNVSSFHFDARMDVTDMLRDGSLKHLRSLSASPCGLRLTSSLSLLAQNCSDLNDLDVRIESKGSFQRCAGCDDFVVDASRSLVLSDDFDAAFPKGLARLTLSGLSGYGCLWLIKSCGPTATIRLSDCSAGWHGNYTILLRTLSSNGALVCLVLKDEHLDFTETSLLNNLGRLVSLKHLYFLSAAQLSDDVVDSSLRDLCPSLRRLVRLHVHYRSVDDGGRDRRVTWVPELVTDTHCRYFVIKNSPCQQCCSTATFIGLAKPLNRFTTGKHS